MTECSFPSLIPVDCILSGRLRTLQYIRGRTSQHIVLPICCEATALFTEYNSRRLESRLQQPASMLVAIAAYCIVLGVIAATALVASKGKAEVRKRNISANAQAWPSHCTLPLHVPHGLLNDGNSSCRACLLMLCKAYARNFQEAALAVMQTRPKGLGQT